LQPREAAKQRRDIGMVVQHFNLFLHMTLENVIEPPIRVKKRRKDDVVESARKLLDRVGLADKEKTAPGAAVRRATAARGDRSCARHGSQADAFRRAKLRTRP
jgi:ABC-type histidine transport system ATPase subunit